MLLKSYDTDTHDPNSSTVGRACVFPDMIDKYTQKESGEIIHTRYLPAVVVLRREGEPRSIHYRRKDCFLSFSGLTR